MVYGTWPVDPAEPISQAEKLLGVEVSDLFLVILADGEFLDGTVLIDGDYIIRGVAGRILFAMLTEYQRSGRVRFSNRERRLNRDIGLPAGHDNLDARLVTLRRRLAERGDPFQLQSVGRGQLELIVTSAVHVDRSDPGNLP
jgi:hypothetical protein